MRRARILIVDDEAQFADNLLKLLSKRGFDVVAVNDGVSALRTVEDEEFDVVLLDLKMPGMHGIDALKAMRKKKPLTEVIILTGHGSVDSAVEGMGIGAFDYAVKPIGLVELVDKIRQAFERRLLRESSLSRQ